MSFTFNSFQALLIPLIIVFGIIGLRRGFWREVGITGGMAIVVLAIVLFPVQFIGFINRIIINIPRVFGLLLNRDTSALPADLIFGDISSPEAANANGRFLLARFAMFILLTFLVYITHFGWAYETGKDAGKPRVPKTSGEKVLGAIFGGITGFLWFAALNDFVTKFEGLRGNPIIPPGGSTLSVPAVSNIGALLAFVPTIIIILIIILLILAALRLPKIWR